MAKAPVKTKTAAKSALTKSETLLSTKSFQRAAMLFQQVSNPTRLEIIAMLSERECHVGGLCEQFNVTQPAVSHHLGLLLHGGIVEVRRRGKEKVYTLTDTGRSLSSLVKGVTP